MQSVFRGAKKVSKGRFLNLSERASWMTRNTDAKDFSGDGEKDRLACIFAPDLCSLNADPRREMHTKFLINIPTPGIRKKS